MIKPTDVTGLGPAGIIALERKVVLPDPRVRAYIWGGKPADHGVLSGNRQSKGARWGAIMIGPKGSLPPVRHSRPPEEG